MISLEGNIVNIDKTFRGRVEIGANGIIASVGGPTGTADIVLNEELIFPGFIDLHVHARESADHSQDYKEDFITAGQAAINGGVVAFADMPNNSVPPVDDASYEDKSNLAKKSAVEVVLYAGIGPRTRPLTKNAPYKVFMGPSVGDLFFQSFEQLESVLAAYSGRNISFHCEDPLQLEQSQTAVTHELRRPPEAEIAAVDVALRLIEKYQLQGKICHCSTAAGLEKIVRAKQSGLPVTAEVTPHHLYFDQSMMTDANRKMFQVNPPIRQTPENRLALIHALKNGDIDCLATDHAPHTREDKRQGVSGLPHLDTYGPFASWLMAEQQFSPADIARVCSYNPGQFINAFSPMKFGRIAPGFAGCLTVMNPSLPVRIEQSMLKTKSGWSPFEGLTFPGRVIMTIIKGRICKSLVA